MWEALLAYAVIGGVCLLRWAFLKGVDELADQIRKAIESEE